MEARVLTAQSLIGEISFKAWSTGASWRADGPHQPASRAVAHGTGDPQAPRQRGPSAHFPKFVLHRSTHLHELRKVVGYSQTY